jgi:hypothetical protein
MFFSEDAYDWRESARVCDVHCYFLIMTAVVKAIVKAQTAIFKCLYLIVNHAIIA